MIEMQSSVSAERLNTRAQRHLERLRQICWHTCDGSRRLLGRRRNAVLDCQKFMGGRLGRARVRVVFVRTAYSNDFIADAFKHAYILAETNRAPSYAFIN